MFVIFIRMEEDVYQRYRSLAFFFTRSCYKYGIWQPLKELNGQTDTCVTRNKQLRNSKEHDWLSKEIRVRREAG